MSRYTQITDKELRMLILRHDWCVDRLREKLKDYVFVFLEYKHAVYSTQSVLEVFDYHKDEVAFLRRLAQIKPHNSGYIEYIIDLLSGYTTPHKPSLKDQRVLCIRTLGGV